MHRMKKRLTAGGKRKNQLLAIAFVAVGSLVAACDFNKGNSSLSTSDYVGEWSGTTSQEYPVSLKVENSSGKATVTDISYKIKIRGPSWSVTIFPPQGQPISAEVVDGAFTYKDSLSELSLSLRGEFYSASSLRGSLDASWVHPQGLGTAIGKVKFTATKK